MKFRSPTDQPLYVALTTGHTCVISPSGDEIDQMFHREAISRGAVPASVTEADAPADAGFDRNKVIAAAMNAMLDSGDEDEFTNDGKPDLRKLTGRAGFKVSREEADAIWAEVSAQKD